MSLEKRAVVIGLILILLLPMTSLACERYFDLVVENQTTQSLTVYVEGNSVGTIEPGQQITKKLPGISNQWLVVAKNSQGETVFSKTLTRQQMQHVTGSDTFKVVISPLQQGSESSGNVTEK